MSTETFPPLPGISAEHAKELYGSRAKASWREQGKALISEAEESTTRWRDDIEAEHARQREARHAALLDEEINKARELTKEAEARVQAQTLDIARLKAALEHALEPDQTALLTGTTPEQIAQQVEVLLGLKGR